MLSRIANFDDLDPLKLEAGVDVQFVPPGQSIPLDSDAIILLGTKSALDDLRFLRAQGWHYENHINASLDQLADSLNQHLDFDALLADARAKSNN